MSARLSRENNDCFVEIEEQEKIFTVQVQAKVMIAWQQQVRERVKKLIGNQVWDALWTKKKTKRENIFKKCPAAAEVREGEEKR